MPGTRNYLWKIFGIGSLSLLSGCTRCSTHSQPPTDDVNPKIQISWTSNPAMPSTGVNHFTFRPIDDSGKPVLAAKLSIEATMNHPGMAPAFAQAADDGHGAYSTDLKLDMAGDWVFFLELCLADGKIIHIQREFPRVQKAN